MRIGLNGWFAGQPHVGSGQYVLHLQRELAQQFDLTCLTFRPTGGDVAVPLRLPGALGKVWFEQLDLPRAARGQVDLLHYPYFASPLFKSGPTVVTIHDLIPFLFPEYHASPQARLYNALIARAARRADAVIAVSGHTRSDIITHLGIPAERVRVTYEAADAVFVPQDAAAVAAIKQRYGLGTYLYYIGGLNRHKNVGALLAAYAGVLQRLPAARQLVIAGKAHSTNQAVFPDVRRMAAELGLTWTEGGQPSAADVRLLGYVPEEDKPALYTGASLFVYPSLYEGFGFCPLEAMACGTPVICSRAASLPEIVGDGGILVDPRNVQAIADAMLNVLTNAELASSLSQRGLRQAARFSWARTAQETAAVYAAVLGRPGRSFA